MNYKKWQKLNTEKHLYNFSSKSDAVDNAIGYMLSRTQSMFRYDNLPDTIPARILELYLQINGNACFTEITQEQINASDRARERGLEPGVYVFCGGMGGELDQYYMPTIYTVANPYLNFSANLKIDKDCIVVPSDSLYMGLLPLFSKYATLLTENELSIYDAIINLRIESIISANDDTTKKSAEKYLDDLINGKIGIIAEKNFVEDGLHVNPFHTAGSAGGVQNLIELEQYLRATWYNDLGLNANYNMKRESLNSTESQLNDDALLPLVDDMLNQRKIGLEKVNKQYGLNISVSLNSAWEDNQQETEEPDSQEGGVENESESENAN